MTTSESSRRSPGHATLATRQISSPVLFSSDGFDAPASSSSLPLSQHFCLHSCIFYYFTCGRFAHHQPEATSSLNHGQSSVGHFVSVSEAQLALKAYLKSYCITNVVLQFYQCFANAYTTSRFDSPNSSRQNCSR